MKSTQSIEKWIEFVKAGPHEFTIQYPPRPEYFMSRFTSGAPLKNLPTADRSRLLYVHVPFCAQKCSYCIFQTDSRPDQAVMERYVHAVLEELKGNPRLHVEEIEHVDVGGGTPTRLPTRLFEKLLSELGSFGDHSENAERSFETSVVELCREPDKARIARSCGFDRISMGVQTTDESTLRNVRREQHWRDVVDGYNVARSAKIERVNMDLIFGLQTQDMHQWREDVSRVAELRPDSITTYDCLYRGNGRQLVSAGRTLPSLELLGQMYDWAYEYLTGCGYHADYGSVNFSMRAGELGTSKYFERRILWGEPYIGIGNYATTLLKGHWLFNYRNVDDYADHVLKGLDAVEFHYELPIEEQFAKYLLYSLNYGVIMPDRFADLFDRDLLDEYGPELDYAISEGWLKRNFGSNTLYVGSFSRIHLLRSLFYTKEAKLWFMRWCGRGVIQ